MSVKILGQNFNKKSIVFVITLSMVGSFVFINTLIDWVSIPIHLLKSALATSHASNITSSVKNMTKNGNTTSSGNGTIASIFNNPLNDRRHTIS